MLLRLALILSLVFQTLTFGAAECVISACAPAQFASAAVDACPPDCCDAEASTCCCVESDDRPAPSERAPITISIGERTLALPDARPIGVGSTERGAAVAHLPAPSRAAPPSVHQRLAVLCVRTT